MCPPTTAADPISELNKLSIASTIEKEFRYLNQ
jgi:hypothetical protein